MWYRGYFLLLLATGAQAWIPCTPKTNTPPTRHVIRQRRPREESSSSATTTTTTTTRLGIGNIFGSDTSKTNSKNVPSLPRDVKEAVNRCREATQEALKKRISRMDIEFPVGAKFNVEPQPKRKKQSSTTAAAAADNNAMDTPTTADLARSDRELARLFVDMFQPVGGEHLTVVFNDVYGSDAAKSKWKGDATAQCRIVSLDRRKSAAAGPKKKAKKARGFAAKMAAEIGHDDDNGVASGPFKLPEKTEVCLFVAPGPKELVIVERVCEEVGMGTLVVILNGRLSLIDKFGTVAAAKLFTEEFESVFHLAAFQPQDVAPNCLLHRSYPGRWVLARKPKVGAPKTILVTDDKPTPEEGAQAFDSIEISDMEKGVEDMVTNVAGWFQ